MERRVAHTRASSSACSESNSRSCFFEVAAARENLAGDLPPSMMVPGRDRNDSRIIQPESTIVPSRSKSMTENRIYLMLTMRH